MTDLFSVETVLWLSTHPCAPQLQDKGCHKPGSGLSGKLFCLLKCCRFLWPNLGHLESRSYWHIYFYSVFWLAVVLFVRAVICSLFSLAILWANIVFTIFIWFFSTISLLMIHSPASGYLLFFVVTFQITACTPGIVVTLLECNITQCLYVLPDKAGTQNTFNCIDLPLFPRLNSDRHKYNS